MRNLGELLEACDGNQQPSLEFKSSLKVQRLTLETTKVEYNRDTSAQLHRNMDEDIVRHSSKLEAREAKDKEPWI